jgi:hypothetical protein
MKRSYGRVSGPRADPYRMGRGRPLELPVSSSMRDPRFATRSMGVVDTPPLRPAKGRRGAHEQVEEHTPIALSGPRLRGSLHGYTFCTYPIVSKRQSAHMALPRPAETTLRPAETNASQIGSSTQKTLQECTQSSKASRATTAVALAWPHGTSQRPEGKRVLTESLCLLRVPMDTAAKARGLLSRTTIGVN